jgi:ribosomal protein S18 acetylase RimI-like enzyme
MTPHPDSIEIRPAHFEDYEAIVAVWQEAGLPYRPRGRDAQENVRQELERGRGAFLVAESDGRLVGAVLGTHDGRKGWINRLAVIPAYRRRGIARRLVQEVEAWLDREGIPICAALIESANQSSLLFFADIGYVLDGDIKYVSKRKTAET